jgi:hypothetical protein
MWIEGGPMSFRKALVVSVLFSVIAPAAARADGMIIPFMGVNFGGHTQSELSDALDAKRFNWGVSFAYMGGGVFGLEGDIGRSPDFFGKTDIGGSSVLTATANLLLGIPLGGQTGFGVRPYGVVGFGVIRSQVDNFSDILSFDNSKAAWNFGGGVMIFFASHVGIRGDLRYFRTIGDVDLSNLGIHENHALDFARGSAGLILRF